MTTTAKIAPPHSFVMVADVLTENGIPDFPTESRLAATASCIIVGCEHEGDSETVFTIGIDHQVDPGFRPVFESVIETPNRKVSVWTTDIEKFLEEKVPTKRTRVRIWGNRQKFPDDVVIGLSEAD